MKIRTKIFVTNLIIILLLLGSLSYVWVDRSSKIIMENIIENANLSLSQVSVNLSNKLLSYEEIANTLYSDNTLQKEFIQTYNNLSEAYDIYFNRQQPFERAIQTTKDVFRLDIFTENPTYTFSNVHLIDDEIKSNDWYTQVMQSSTGSYWTKAYGSGINDTPVFSIRKRLNNLVKNSKLIVSVEIHTKVLYELINEESKDKRYIFTLQDGTVLIDSIKNNKISNINQLPFYEYIASTDEGSYEYTDGHQDYLILHQTLQSREQVLGMKVISYIPLDELMPKVDEMRNLAFVLFLVACGVSGVIILAFSIGITRRISELSLKMRRVDKDNFLTSVAVRGNDEISQLGNIFNLMVGRIGQLIREVYQSEISSKEFALRSKEAELYALQTQINPHFLFNVLNMIRGNLLITGDRDNAKIIGLLAKSFRMMLKTGGQTIPLSEEVEFIDIYLRLQKYRYTDKFQYTIDIPAHMQKVEIPKLCIQPLVENAITHGIELKESDSIILISAKKEDGRITITVEDNGLGITMERLVDIHKLLNDKHAISNDTHIGLQNVNQRLKHLYGDEYGLQVESQSGIGTKVTMSLPDETIRGDSDV